MSNYLLFRAGLCGDSPRISRNSEDVVRKGASKKKQVSEDKKKQAIKEFQNDFNEKEMP